MGQRNPFNFLKGMVAKTGFLGAGFGKKLLTALSEDRVYPGKGLKETPGQEGRMIELSEALPNYIFPFRVDWDGKKITVSHNWGTVAYLDEYGELKSWRPDQEEVTFTQEGDCYIYIEYTHGARTFALKVSTRQPEHWSSDGNGNPTKSTAIIAVIRDRKVRQHTFNSFIVSPFWTGSRGVMEFSFYPTVG